MLTYFVYAPLLVLVFLGFCRLLFGKSPLCKQKAVFKTYNQAQLRLCFFLCQAVGKVLTYLCTFRSLSSPSSTCAPCSAFGQRLARDNNSATHARLSRFSTLALRLIISLFQTRSAPRPRLSRLLPFALWQVTSLQAKSSVQDAQPKHNFGCAFFFVRLCACCSRTSCTLRYACSPFAIFNACSAPDYLFVSNTLRASFSSFSALAVCSLAIKNTIII